MQLNLVANLPFNLASTCNDSSQQISLQCRRDPRCRLLFRLARYGPDRMKPCEGSAKKYQTLAKELQAVDKALLQANLFTPVRSICC
jgi:hypothetical protein